MQPHPTLGMLSLAALPVGVRALSVLTVSPMKFRPIKFRTFILPLALAAGLVLVLGVGLLGGLALRNPLYLLDRGGQSIPEAFQFVPKQSALVASVLARPDRLAQLWDYLADPRQRPTLRTDRERLERAMLAQTGLSYERDLQPWLGEEITVALVTPDLDQDPSNGLAPGYLVALACRDADLARSTLELFWQNRALAGDPLAFEDLGGTRLIYSRASGRSATSSGFTPLATAVVTNRFILVANDPGVLRRALAAAQSVGDNLRTDGRYRLALKTLDSHRIGLLAVNLPQLEQWLHPNPSANALIHAPWVTDHPPLDWGLISLGLQRQGVLAEAAWVVSPGHQLDPHQRAITDWYPLARYLPDFLSLTSVGLSLADLEDDLSPWLDPWVGRSASEGLLTRWVGDKLGPGEAGPLLAKVDQRYALGLVLSAKDQPLQGLMVTPSSPGVLTAIDTLEKRAQAQGLSMGRLDILGYPTTVWTSLSLRQNFARDSANRPLQVQTDVAGLRAEVGHDQVFATSAELMEQALGVDQHPDESLAWIEAIEAFPQAGESYVHLDWIALEGYLRQQIPQFRLWDTVARPALKHLQAVTLASYGQTDQVHHAGLFIQLQNP